MAESKKEAKEKIETVEVLEEVKKENTASSKSKVSEKEKVEDKPKKKTARKPKTNNKVCKILWYRNSKIAFDFDGFGLSYKSKEDLSKKVKSGFIEVEFKGEFGKEGFKVIDVK